MTTEVDLGEARGQTPPEQPDFSLVLRETK